MDAFKYALDWVSADEGGFSNDVQDHGGATKYGITIGDLSEWRGHSCSVQEVRDLTQDEAAQIYKKRYWDSISLGSVLNPYIACAIFDIGVVRGISVGAKYAQMTCCDLGHIVAIDRHIGPKSLAAINTCAQKDFILNFAQLAKEGFQSIVDHNPSQRVFLKGWTRRANRIKELATKG